MISGAPYLFCGEPSGTIIVYQFLLFKISHSNSDWHSQKPSNNSQIPDRIEPFFDLVKSWLDMEEKGGK